ncbi:MAG: hypothetical protein JKY54_03560 [Flavobacteriales bacterium]|nr:hypothetical protein [Flavobacteriales bacterium]
MYSIKNPCNENWNQMSPMEQGRFCVACKKKVLDLEGTSKKEQKAIYGKGECVRISIRQLATLNRTKLIKQFAVASFLIFGSSLYSFAGELTDVNNQFTTLLLSDSITVKGSVVHEDNPTKPYPYLHLTCKIDGDEYDAYTDSNGVYSFVIPANSGKVEIAIQGWKPRKGNHKIESWKFKAMNEDLELAPQKSKFIPHFIGKF